MKVKKMALISILGAMASILMALIHFNLPFMPPFMDFDLSSIPELVGGFALGPASAVMIIAIKILIKLVIMPTTTMFTGEIQNFILSACFVLPAVLIYQRNKSKKSALQGMIAGTALCSIVAVFSNLYFIIPFYAKLFTNLTFESVIASCTAVNPLITDGLTLALFGIVPFNIIKCGTVSFVTYVLYKKISIIIKNFVR